MKKILILLLLIPCISFGQGKNLHNKSVGIYNIMDYGAIPGDGNEDATAIQNAINAAYADVVSDGWNAMGGTVMIPPGVWNITKPDTLKSFIEIDIASGSLFVFPNGYTGKMWVVNGLLSNATIRGGTYIADDASSNWTLLDLTSTSNSLFILFNKFYEMYGIQPSIGINLITTDDGWINGNLFRDFKLWKPLTGLRTRESGSSSGLDQNRFENFDIQYGASSVLGIDSLTGQDNIFVNFMTYDILGDTKDAYITPESSRSTFISGNIDRDKVIDRGVNTIALTAGDWTQIAIDTLQVNKTLKLETYNITDLVAGTGITKAMLHASMLYVQEAAIDISANPQIVAGSPGEIIIIEGRSDTYTLTLDDTDGLSLTGQCVLGRYDTIMLKYDGYSGLWVEVSRSNN